MKASASRWSVLVLLLVTAAPLRAELDLPKYVYTTDRLAEATAEAKAKGKMLTFMLTRKDSQCGLCIGASRATIDEFGRSTVMVYVESGTGDLDRIPEAVKTALRSPESGKFIPKSTLFNPETEQVIHILPYGRGDDMDDNIKQAKRSLSATKRESMARGNPRPALPALPAGPLSRDLNRDVRTWTSTGGSTVQASIVEEQGIYCVLKTAEGEMVKIPLSRLSPEDRAYIDGLKQQRAQAP